MPKRCPRFRLPGCRVSSRKPAVPRGKAAGRAVGLGGLCPHCDEPILAAELLGEEGVL